MELLEDVFGYVRPEIDLTSKDDVPADKEPAKDDDAAVADAAKDTDL